MTKSLHVTIHTPERNLMERVKLLAKPAGTGDSEVAQQIALLAQAVEELDRCCSDLTGFLKTLVKNVTFTAK
jgi:hypothetical protein